MPEEYVKSNVFAAKVDDLFRGKDKINMETTPFDYENFLNEVQLPTPVTSSPISMVMEAEEPYGRNPLPEAIDTAEIKAALSGKFSPVDLFDKKIAAAQRIKTLNILSTDCIVESMTDLSWQLNRQRRTIVLNRLIARGQLQSELDKPLPATDVFGTLLRGVLKEQATYSTAKLKSTDIIELANVLETLQSVDIPKPDLNEVKSKIQSPGFLDEYSAISEGFIGRKEELHFLHKFLEPGKKGKDFPVTSEGIVLTGVGGVGKSTLIAKFTSDVVTQNQATVVILDFDRPGINASDPPWLAQEISRQIGLQYPELNNEMYEVRIKARENKKLYALGKGSFSDADLAGELAASIIYDIKDRLAKTKVSTVPFLLILDTLEEVAQKDEASYLLEFLSKLAGSFTGFIVKIIFSGRLYDEQLKSFTSISYIKDKPIQVNEFDHTIARQFLLNQQLTNNMATRIVQSKLIPLRPLELKLVATLLIEGKVSFNALSKELQQLKGKRGSKNLFTGIIYRRVLMRIKDKEVRDIAYPGLILRYITPEIIINILQPALKLRKMNEQEAAVLVTKLAKLNWLTYADSKGRIWHQRELRRSMLHLMLMQDEKTTITIRNAAISYFSGRTSDEDQAEHIYHRLMDLPGHKKFTKPDLRTIGKAYSDISRDAADLPPKAVAILNYAGGHTLGAKELYLLPKIFFRDAVDSVGKQLLSDRQFWAAAELVRRAGLKAGMSEKNDTEELLSNWREVSLFSVVDWKRLGPRVHSGEFSKQASLVTLLNVVFPYTLIRPSGAVIETIDYLISLARKNKFPFGQVTQKVNQIQVLSRLSVCLSILDYYRVLSPYAIASLKFIISLSKIPDPTPTLQKALCLLNMIGGQRPLDSYSPGTSLLRLDREWLDQLSKLLPRSKNSLIKRTEELLDAKETNVMSARSFLGRLNNFSEGKKEWHETRIDLRKINGQKLYDLLKGPDPVYRDPVRYAILDAFKNRKDYELLAKLMQRSIPFPLMDLKGESLETMLDDNRELALEPFIEIIDRCWNLDKFLKLACRAKPKAKKLTDVRHSYDRWQMVLKTMLTKRKF